MAAPLCTTICMTSFVRLLQFSFVSDCGFLRRVSCITKLTRSVFLPGGVDLNFRLCRNFQLLRHLLSCPLRVTQHDDEALVVHQGTLGTRQTVKQTIFELLHPPFICSHIFQKTGSFFLQFLLICINIFSSLINNYRLGIP